MLAVQSIAAVLISSALAVSVSAVVVPNGLAMAEGNDQTFFPFSCASAPSQPTSQRLQEIYGGAEVGNGTITEIRFRQDGDQGNAFPPTVLPDVTIALSTTAVPVGALSSAFAENIGPDVTTVFSGNLVLSSAPCSSSPCPFDIVIPLSTPFPFDASAGNLLLDVTIPTCVETSEFDAFSSSDIMRVFTLGSGYTSPDADIRSMVGLVTQFTFRPTSAPAMSGWGMSGLFAALLAFGAAAARRRSRR